MTRRPDATYVIPIPEHERQRVLVRRAGPGTTLDRLMLGDTVTGIGVVLDNGGRTTIAPAEVKLHVDTGPSNVVDLASRRAAVRAVEP